MKYMGSKARFINEILPIITKDRKENQWFVDLFCGGCSIAQEVKGKVIANDKNKYLIAMFEGLQENKTRPYEITKDLYNVARDVYNGKEKSLNKTMEMDDFMVGWIGWMGSYNGKFFDETTNNEVKAYQTLEALGYDQVPGGSNYYDGTEENILNNVKFCVKNITDQRLFGFIQSPWKYTLEENRAHILKSIELAGEAKAWFDKNHK